MREEVVDVATQYTSMKLHLEELQTDNNNLVEQLGVFQGHNVSHLKSVAECELYEHKLKHALQLIEKKKVL